MSADARPEYQAVRHVLTAPQIAHRTAQYIHADDFDFAGLEGEVATMSGGEALLISVARELWLAEACVGLSALVNRLDPLSFERVLDALRAGRGYDLRAGGANFADARPGVAA